MADQADVETALAALVANAIYPNGSAAAGVVNALSRIYRGYPTAAALDADLAAGIFHVSVAADTEIKNMTRYPRIWRTVAPVPATLSVLVAGSQAIFAGVCAVGQLAGVAADGGLFPYAVQASDTPATVASNLAAMLRAAGWLVDYAGSSITLPAATDFTARVVNGAGALQEIKRQAQNFKISLWCPSPAVRDAAAPVIDDALAVRNFLPLADGSSARLIFIGTMSQDNAADATLYRRDIVYSAEYPTTLAQITPAMLFGTARFTADGAFVETLNA